MDERPLLRVAYADFWKTLNPEDNFFSRLLSRRFRVEFSSSPDLLIHSCYGGRRPSFRDFDCLRLFVNWENRGWGFAETDLAITCDYNEHVNHRRFPLYAAELSEPFVQPQVDAGARLRSKKGFAAVVVSNPKGTTRNRVHDLLDSYKQVASGGRFRNNLGGPVADKSSFVSDYKFTLACENSSYPGYTTEKLVDALRADTVPIYWGNPRVTEEFNGRRFLNYHDFPSEQALIRRVIELDQDDEAYREVLAEPWFVGGAPPACASKELLVDWLFDRVTEGRTPVAKKRGPLRRVHRLSDAARARIRAARHRA